MVVARWGYSSWNCGWHGTTAVVYHGGAYYGNTAWHGGYYGSSASAYGAYGSAHASNGYNPSTGTYARGGTVSNGYGSVSAGQAYNPRTGASASTVQGSNAYGSYGSLDGFEKRHTPPTASIKRTRNGTTGQMHTSNGGSAYAASGKYGNSAAVGQTANGDKYAAANGNTYKNTGSGWSATRNGSSNQATIRCIRAGEGRKRAAGHRPSAEVAAEAGGPGRRVLVVRYSRGGGGGWGGRR